MYIQETSYTLAHTGHFHPTSTPLPYAAKNEQKIFPISKEIQKVSDAKSYMRKSFLIYEEMRKYLAIHEEDVSHI
jgi:hypothetical protein